MNVPKPQDRPDYKHWTTPREKRKSLSESEMAEMLEALEEYSRARFSLGRRFKLLQSFYGLPKGTCCTVISMWPNTQIRWDKWSRHGYGAQRRTRAISFDLDQCLENL